MSRAYDIAYDAARLGVKLYMTCSLHKIEVKGRENVPKRAIIANTHASFADAPIIVSSLEERIYFLSKPKLMFISSIGREIIYGQMKPDNFRRIKKKVEEGYLFGIMPQGKICPEGQIDEINGGVFNLARLLQLPIVPVAIKGTKDVWPLEQKLPKPLGRIKVNIGEPMYVGDKRNGFNGELRDQLRELYKTA